MCACTQTQTHKHTHLKPETKPKLLLCAFERIKNVSKLFLIGNLHKTPHSVKLMGFLCTERGSPDVMLHPPKVQLGNPTPTL